MSAVLATAMLLQCFFNRPADGSVASNDTPVIKVALPAEMARSMSAKQPPTGRFSFTGESEPAREWIVAGDSAAESVQLLRVALSDALLSPSPYSARFGIAIRNDDGSYRFENRMAGYCKLIPSTADRQ